MKFDLHMHTTRYSPDSFMEPLDLVRKSKAIGLDGVVITEHDWLWTEPELDELRAAASGLVVLAGVEVSAREGHFLAYGVHNRFALARGIGVAALCREAHRQGGAVVAAHPFRFGQRFSSILRSENPELDGLELMSSNMDADCRERAAAIQRTYFLAGLGSSDAHSEDVLGVCYTEFDAEIRDGRDLVEAIRSRRGTAHDRTADSH
jgi:predicted metal-dependent phosphoesterase TrpH